MMLNVDRIWFLTWTTYGTWLPGDERGFVSTIRDEDDSPVRHNIPGTAYDKDIEELKRYSADQLKCKPIYLQRKHSLFIEKQFHETAAFRNWILIAYAIMCNHIHLLVGVRGDPDPEKILGDFKSYASRTLNKNFGYTLANTWWTQSGSKRKIKNEQHFKAVVQYIQNQQSPLIVWTNGVLEEK